MLASQSRTETGLADGKFAVDSFLIFKCSWHKRGEPFVRHQLSSMGGWPFLLAGCALVSEGAILAKTGQC
jgi:hypothetical protein